MRGVAIKDFKGGSVVGRVDSGVDNEFGHRKVFIPIILSTADVEAEILLDFLVGPFCLSVSLRMIGGGQVGFDAETPEKGAHDFGGELGAAVADEPEGKAVETEDFSVVDVGNSFGGDVRGAGEGVEKLTVVVDKDDNGIMSTGLRKLGDKVDSNSLPGTIGYL